MSKRSSHSPIWNKRLLKKDFYKKKKDMQTASLAMAHLFCHLLVSGLITFPFLSGRVPKLSTLPYLSASGMRMLGLSALSVFYVHVLGLSTLSASSMFMLELSALSASGVFLPTYSAFPSPSNCLPILLLSPLSSLFAFGVHMLGLFAPSPSGLQISALSASGVCVPRSTALSASSRLVFGLFLPGSSPLFLI